MEKKRVKIKGDALADEEEGRANYHILISKFLVKLFPPIFFLYS